MLDELVPSARHVTEQYANNTVEADHGLVVTTEGNSNRATCEALITHGERGFQIDLRLPNAN